MRFHAEQVEEVVRVDQGQERFRRPVACDVVLRVADRGEVFKQSRLLLQVVEFQHRELAHLAAALGHQAHEPVGFAVRRSRFFTDGSDFRMNGLFREVTGSLHSLTGFYPRVHRSPGSFEPGFPSID